MPDQPDGHQSQPRIRIPRDGRAALRLKYREALAARLRSVKQDSTEHRLAFVRAFGQTDKPDERGEPTADMIFDAFAKLAPSDHHLAWICRKFTDPNQPVIPAEDIYKIGEDIALLQKYHAQIRKDGGRTDIAHYPDVTTLAEAMRPYRALAGKKLETDKAAAAARAESTILYKDLEEGMIVVPHSRQACCFWGLNTRWCISARKESENAFEDYNKAGPIVIFLRPDGSKYALNRSHLGGGLRDSEDHHFLDLAGDLRKLLAAAPEPVQRFVLAQAPPRDSAGKALDPALTDVQRYAALAHQICPPFDETMCDGTDWRNLPEKMRASSEFWQLVVQKIPTALNEMPQELCTEDFCKTAVEKNPNLLGHLPKRHRKAEIYAIGLRQNGYLLRHVPLEMMGNAELHLLAVEHGARLKDVPEPLRDEKICALAVRQDGSNLGSVPKALRRADICLAAVTQNSDAFPFVPDTLQSEAILRETVRKKGSYLARIPEGRRSEEICRLAVMQNGLALEHVPEKWRTDELFKLAVRQNGDALRYIPSKKRSKEICRLAVQQNGLALCHVREDWQGDEDIRKLAVRQNGEAIKVMLPAVPYKSILWELAIEQAPMVLTLLPEDRRSTTLCRIAVQKDGAILRHVPEDERSLTICRAALAQNDGVLFEIPEAHRLPLLRERPDLAPQYGHLLPENHGSAEKLLRGMGFIAPKAAPAPPRPAAARKPLEAAAAVR